MISKRYCFKGFLQFACVDLSSCISLLLHWLRSLIIIRSVLRAMVVGTRIDLRLGIVGVRWIRRLLLRVDCKQTKYTRLKQCAHLDDYLGAAYRASDTVNSAAPPSHARCAGRQPRRTTKWQPADKCQCLSRPQCTTNHRSSSYYRAAPETAHISYAQGTRERKSEK